MAINKKLISFATQAQFDAQVSAGNIDNRSIVFIEDKKRIWTHGVYFDTLWDYIQNKPSTLDGYGITDAAKKINSLYYVEGNTTGTAGAWTGSIPEITSLYAGLTIAYKIGVAGASTTNLDINSLGNKLVRRNTSNLTTHLPVGSVVILTYDGTYWVWADYDSGNSYDRTYWGNAITAGAPIYSYKLLMQGLDGKFYPLTLETGTGTTKTVSTQEFEINSQILYYATTATVAANGTATNVYSEYPVTTLSYTANQASWTSQQLIYLKGTILSNGNFKLDNTSHTSFMTQTLPTTVDGFVYVLLGYMYTTTAMRLFQFHPMYEYRDGALRTYMPMHSHGNITDGGAIGSVANKPIITGAGGVLQVGSFGTLANTFAEGNHTHSYLPLSGGTLTGSSYNILELKRSSANGSSMLFSNSSVNLGKIGFIANGDLIIGTGTSTDGVADMLSITSSGIAQFYGNISTSGLVTGTGFSKTGATDAHVLLGSGGHKSIADFNASLVTSTSASGTTNIATFNTNTYLNIVQGGTSVGSSTQIIGSNGITVASDATGKLTITGLGAHAGIYSSRANGLGASSNSIEAKDTRNINPLPNTDLQRGVWFDFKTNSAIGLTGASTYSSVITMVPYGDNSGNSNTSFRLAQSENNLYFQNWTTVWGTWNKIWHSGNLANGTTAQYIRGDGSLATYTDTTYSTGTLDQLNAGTDTTGRLQTAKLLNDWLNPKLALKATPADISTAINATLPISTKRDFINGTLVTTSIDYSVTNGNPFYMTISGNSYGRINSVDTVVQGYIYNNTIINYGVTHKNPHGITGIVAMNVGGNLCFWFPRQAYWEGYSIMVTTAYNYNINTITSITDIVKPVGTKEVNLSSNTKQAAYHNDNLSNFTDNIGVTSHIANTSNPHSVTKAQVGLGNVDNTSDTNKPVSTAMQTALNLKANLASPTFTGSVTAPTFIGALSGNADTATTATYLTRAGVSIITAPSTHGLRFDTQISSSTTGIFPTLNNSNTVITLNRHSGAYDSQLGFSSDGNIYYRAFTNAALNTTQAWRTVWDSGNLTNLNQLTTRNFSDLQNKPTTLAGYGVLAADTMLTAKNASLITSTITTGITNTATSNINTYLNIVQGGSVSSSTKITGAGAVTVSSDINGAITIHGSEGITYSSGTKELLLPGTDTTNRVWSGKTLKDWYLEEIDILLDSDRFTGSTFSSNVIDLTNVNGALNVNSANNYTTYTLSNKKVRGAWAKVLVNSSLPITITGVKLINLGSSFEVNTDMYLNVMYDGINTLGYYTKVTGNITLSYYVNTGSTVIMFTNTPIGNFNNTSSSISIQGVNVPKNTIKNICLADEYSSTTIINEYFLYGCSSLTSLDLSGMTNVTSIGDYFLYNCTALTSLNLSSMINLTSIGDYFLDDCRSLTSVDLSPLAGVASIGSYFLGQCAALTSVDLSPLASVTSIGTGFLNYCTSLTSVDLRPLASVTSIGTSFLNYCTSLTSVNLSSMTNITSIGVNFLTSCTKLTSVDLSSMTNLTSIGGNFLGVSGVTTLKMGAIVPPSLSELLPNTLTSILVPSAAVNAYKSAYGWSQKASIITGY